MKRSSGRGASMRLRALLGSLSLVFMGIVGVTTASPAAAATGNILPPFNTGEMWYVYQGYGPNAYTHHNNQAYPSLYGLDLTVSSSTTATAGKAAISPVSGTIQGNPSTSGTGSMCINMADGRSLTLTHINTSITGGSVSAGQTVGTVAAAGTKGNGGVAHIHFQMWSSHGCWGTGNGGIPFDSAHGARICGAPDLTSDGPDYNSNGVWSGTSFTGQNCGPSGPVDTDGDGIVDGSDDCPTQAGPSTTNGCPDVDNDTVADASDTCKYFAGASSNRGCRLDSHTVSGNFIGDDGYTDAVSFYQYSNAELGAFVSTGSVDGVGKPQQLWRTGTGQWNWGSSTFLAGNFAGDDSYTDVIGLYDYGNGRLGVFLFQGNGHGVDQGRRLWTTTDGAWKLGNARYVVGNFSGNDGKDDILAFYQYPDNDMGTQVFAGNGDGVSQPQAQWRTGPDHWSVSRAEYIAGNFAGDDDYTDVIAFYQYSNSDTGAFLFQGGAGDIDQPQSLWRTGTGQWTVSNAEYFAGDFYGGDDVTDIVALYRLPNATMRAFVFLGGSGVSREQTLWTTAAGQWYVTKTKGIAGKFSGAASSLFAWYDYGSSDTGGHLFAPVTTGGVQLPQSKWRTGDGQWSWTHM